MKSGFSTKEVATEYSGRGVGMDVVKTKIAQLNCTIDIDSVLGQGSSKIVMPNTRNGGYFALVDSSTTWLSQWNGNYFEQIETPFVADTLLNDFYDIFTHTFNQDTKNPALNAWGWFDDDYQLNTTNYIFYPSYIISKDLLCFYLKASA